MASRQVIEKLFRHPELSIESLPVIKDAFTGVATSCAAFIRELCPLPSSMLVNKVEMESVWDVLERYEGGVAFVYYVPSWDARIVVGLDPRAVMSLIEAVYGSDGGGEEGEIDPERPFSTIELRLAQEIAGRAAESLKESFAEVAEIEFILDRVESKIEFMMMGQTDFVVAFAQVILQIMDRGGQIFVMIPQSAIYPLRQKLQRRGGGGVATIDSDWANRLRTGVSNSPIQLKASIEGGTSTLAEVAKLRVGSIIELPVDAQSNVVVSGNESRICLTKLAQSKGRYVVVVEEFLRDR
ncbi:MAG: flagellar motor switch protein FliM [Filomicrobium sp.]